MPNHSSLRLAGEDLVYMVPNTMSARRGDSTVVLHASLSCGRIAMPPVHKRLGFNYSAMTAAQGKLYLLGGSTWVLRAATTGVLL